MSKQLALRNEAELAIDAWARIYLRKKTRAAAEPFKLPLYNTYKLFDGVTPTPAMERAMRYCRRRSVEEKEGKPK